jgi:hypothetical protein
MLDTAQKVNSKVDYVLAALLTVLVKIRNTADQHRENGFTKKVKVLPVWDELFRGFPTLNVEP